MKKLSTNLARAKSVDNRFFMARALSLARKASARVHPNPKVGCVLVKDGRVVAEAFHAKYGGPHAEALALAKAGKNARGATAFVTLEPCCAHPGKKTPPCVDALIRAGVARVVAATRDPNPDVAGRSLNALRKAGVTVSVGLLGREAERVNADFFARMRRERPYVILKTALSLDGKAAAVGGASRWVTGPKARGLVHKLRAQCDAILVGGGTALADDPALTSHGAGKDPLRVVLEGKRRLPARLQLLRNRAKGTIVFSARPGPGRVVVPSERGRVDLPAVLRALSRRGVERLLVEGGPRVHAEFLRLGLVDEVRVFVAPKFLSGTRDPNAAPHLASPRLAKAGPDFIFSGKVTCSRG